MTKKRDGMDYSEFYLSNYRSRNHINYSNDYYNADVPDSKVTHIPKVTALVPDAIDDEPYAEPHSVEYGAAGKKKRNKPNKNSRSRNRGLILVILTIIVCFGITLLTADTLSGGYILDELQAVFSGGSGREGAYYAVEVCSFADITTARVYSLELRQMGGAGYVIDDGLYRVIAEVYPSRADADTVAAKLNVNGYVPKVYEILIKDINYELFPNSVRNVTKKAIGYIKPAYERLYSLGCELAQGNVDKSNAITQLKGLAAELKKTSVEYEANCDNEAGNDNVMKVRSQIDAICGAVESLCDVSQDGQELLSNIRYTSVLLLNTHRALSNSLQ